jgi:hypothetical protein
MQGSFRTVPVYKEVMIIAKTLAKTSRKFRYACG